MSFVYWFADGVGDQVTNAGPGNQTPIATLLVQWIRANSPRLIVNGGDVYRDGKTADFAKFFNQMGGDVSLMCETPGNHDWEDRVEDAARGAIPHGYETFWAAHANESKQPIAQNKKGGARYDHFIDVGDWRFIFVDTGHHDWADQWPAGDPNRVTWLKNSFKPGRANIVMAHYSRLSRGKHGDNAKIDQLWKTLFDATGAPLVAFTLGGHDHNVSVYKPRKKNPATIANSPAEGVHIFVNGAGGKGHYSGDGFLSRGTTPDIFFDDDNFFVTRINLIDAHTVEVDAINFGTTATTEPQPIPNARVKIIV